MAKVNLDQMNGYEPLKAERRSEVKGGGQTAPIKPPHREIASEKDRLDLSGRAAEAGKMVSKIRELPDVRHEKVEEMKDLIAANAYNPNSIKIATAIMSDEVN